MTAPDEVAVPRAYTVDQVAAALVTPKKTVYALIRTKRLGAIRCGRGFRIPAHELERLLHSGDVA